MRVRPALYVRKGPSSYIYRLGIPGSWASGELPALQDEGQATALLPLGGAIYLSTSPNSATGSGPHSITKHHHHTFVPRSRDHHHRGAPSLATPLIMEVREADEYPPWASLHHLGHTLKTKIFSLSP